MSLPDKDGYTVIITDPDEPHQNNSAERGYYD